MAGLNSTSQASFTTGCWVKSSPVEWAPCWTNSKCWGGYCGALWGPRNLRCYLNLCPIAGNGRSLKPSYNKSQPQKRANTHNTNTIWGLSDMKIVTRQEKMNIFNPWTIEENTRVVKCVSFLSSNRFLDLESISVSVEPWLFQIKLILWFSVVTMQQGLVLTMFWDSESRSF